MMLRARRLLPLLAQEQEGAFQVLGEEPSLDALMGCLERRGAREGALHAALLRNRDAIVAGMPAGPLRCAGLLP
jgi:hypothetical protein